MRRCCKVLLVGNCKPNLFQCQSALTAVAAQKQHPFELSFVSTSICGFLEGHYLQDAELKCLIFQLTGDTPSTWQDIFSFAKQRRSDIDLFLLLLNEQIAFDSSDPISHWVEGLFVQSDADPSAILRTLTATLSRRASTPFFDALQDYVKHANDSWHTPGHAGGSSVKNSPWACDFYEFLGANAFLSDLSVSVPGLDSLLEPRGVIAESQRLAADAFGAQASFFCTNGTSTANKILLQTLLSPGDSVILDRNCHKSVHYGLLLAAAMPVYLQSEVNTELGLYGPIPTSDILVAIDDHPNAKLLVLTNCSYDGFCYNLAPIIERAHGSGIKVLIDEAWYSHAYFHPHFRPSGLESGADYVTQSTHKTMSALSQGSIIHIQDRDVDEHRFRELFNLHASTSPQYTIIASLDVARMQMSMEGYSLWQQTLELANYLREEIKTIAGFEALNLSEMLPSTLYSDGIRLDDTKVTIDTRACGISMTELKAELYRRFSIQVEKNTTNTLSLLLTPGTTQAKVCRLLEALSYFSRQQRRDNIGAATLDWAPLENPKVVPQQAFFAKGEYFPLVSESGGINEALVGRLCADQVVPYPPGSPLLVPGQMLQLADLQQLLNWFFWVEDCQLHGISYRGKIPLLRVLTFEEEADLANIGSLASHSAASEVGRLD